MIRLEKVTKSYGSGEGATHVLKEVDLKIESWEFVAIMGQSGSGKTTLMNMIGCLDTPTKGSLTVVDTDVK